MRAHRCGVDAELDIDTVELDIDVVKLDIDVVKLDIDVMELNIDAVELHISAQRLDEPLRPLEERKSRMGASMWNGWFTSMWSLTIVLCDALWSRDYKSSCI